MKNWVDFNDIYILLMLNCLNQNISDMRLKIVS